MIQSKFVTFQIGRKTYFQKSIKKWKKALLIISVQEVRDQSGYHLSYRIVEFCSAGDMSVHCRWSAGQLFPGTRLKSSAETEQKMPKVLKTAAREEDKVESSQTKIKESRSSLSSAFLWSAMLPKGRTEREIRDICQWAGILDLVFKTAICFSLERSIGEVMSTRLVKPTLPFLPRPWRRWGSF